MVSKKGYKKDQNKPTIVQKHFKMFASNIEFFSSYSE